MFQRNSPRDASNRGIARFILPPGDGGVAHPFIRGRVEAAALGETHLEGADLSEAHLQGKRLAADELHRLRRLRGEFSAVLFPADMRKSFLSPATDLADVSLGGAEYGFVRVADVRWGGVNLAVVNWTQRRKGRRRLQAVILGDEWQAQQVRGDHGHLKDADTRADEFEEAARANRQLATALREQGISERADEFAYRAEVCQRHYLWYRRQIGRWLFSAMLAGLSGYGFRLWRILAAYGVVVTVFALAYFLLGLTFEPHVITSLALLS